MSFKMSRQEMNFYCLVSSMKRTYPAEQSTIQFILSLYYYVLHSEDIMVEVL